MSRFTFFDEGTVNKDPEKSVLEIITPETLSVVNTIKVKMPNIVLNRW